MRVALRPSPQLMPSWTWSGDVLLILVVFLNGHATSHIQGDRKDGGPSLEMETPTGSHFWYPFSVLETCTHPLRELLLGFDLRTLRLERLQLCHLGRSLEQLLLIWYSQAPLEDE